MKLRLNETKAAELKCKAAIYEVRDTVVPGLILRVGKKGQKVWEVVVSRAGKRTRVRLGSFPELSVKGARRDAEARKEASVSSTRNSDLKTVSDLFDRYRTARSENRRAWSDVESAWSVWAKDQIGHVRIVDVTAHHGLDLRDHVSKCASENRAGAVLRYIRPMFSWAADERIIPANPWAGLRSGATSEPRDRVLTDREWESLWLAATAEPYPFGPFVRALMLSGQRLSNVAQMRWDEMRGDVWVIPRDKMKATRQSSASAHEVPLSHALADLVATQPRLGPYVFTTRGDRPIAPGAKLKSRLSSAARLSDWRFHDIRRTAATRIATMGTSRFIIERVLGHSESSVTAVYDRSTYREEKREALTLLARTVATSSADETKGRI